MTGRQFNAAAVEWVMRCAPRSIPSRTAWTLAVVASFTRPDGRGAHPSTREIATLARRSERQVQRDLDELAKHGMIAPGDERATRGLHAGHRPAVWDLAPEARDYLTNRGDKVSPQRRQGVTPGKRGRSQPSGAPKCRHGVVYAADGTGCAVCEDEDRRSR